MRISMNMAIAFFCACATFVLMMGIKIPIKKVNRWLVENFFKESKNKKLLYKRLNVSIMVAAMLLAMFCYYVIAGLMFELSNLKWCYAMKGGAMAIAFHAMYAQWFEVPRDE